MHTELVTTLKRHATEIISDIESGRHPVLITQRGRPAAYLVDVQTFEAMQEQITILKGIARGERAIEEGRVMSHSKAKQRMKRWLK